MVTKPELTQGSYVKSYPARRENTLELFHFPDSASGFLSLGTHLPKNSSVLLRSSITAALGGLLFGFDTVVISGAEKTIQSLWGLRDGIHGLAVSMALWGTVLGAMIGGWPTETFGRKNTLVAIGIMYFVSALWSGFATGSWDFMVARFIGGMGIVNSTVVSPLYISEIAPA